MMGDKISSRKIFLLYHAKEKKTWEAFEYIGLYRVKKLDEGKQEDEG